MLHRANICKRDMSAAINQALTGRQKEAISLRIPNILYTLIWNAVMNRHEDPDEEKRRQVILIHQLAKRLPWIIVIVSLVAFLLIFLQVLLLKN